ncbi:ribonuclease P protein subunit p38 [Centropristis striata]|uniref:ribonuclease P protein subunit p38 n=1 Tax=Centropristis striata TaxID=184440 RepID=UPI0027DEF7D1|nr:ribonuclease P protein subunit p38 [Centropristis striata]
MAAAGKPVKKENKKYVPVKTSFTSPFSPKWEPLPQDDMHFILNTLKDKLVSTGLEKKEVKVFRPWRKKKKDQKPAAAAEVVPQVSQDGQVKDSAKNGWTDVAARRQLAIGINEVTKALERNQLRLLLVCKSAKPRHMTDHLIALSATRAVPACQVPRLSQSLSEPLGLKSVLALGFRHCSSKDDEVFTDTVDAIKPRVPSLDVSWLHGTAQCSSLTPEEPVDMETEEEACQKKGQKRKLESESEEVAESTSSCTLQPLKVKKIVANPAKKKKKAKS